MYWVLFWEKVQKVPQLVVVVVLILRMFFITVVNNDRNKKQFCWLTHLSSHEESRTHFQDLYNRM